MFECGESWRSLPLGDARHRRARARLVWRAPSCTGWARGARLDRGTSYNRRVLTRFARVVALTTIALVPLAVWPGVPEPFTRPRIALLAVAIALVAVALVLARRPWPGVPPSIEWSAAGFAGALAVSASFAPVVSPVAVVLPVLGVAWAVMLRWVSPEPRQIALVIVAGASIVASWALLQFAGLDPLQAAGWLPARAYVGAECACTRRSGIRTSSVPTWRACYHSPLRTCCRGACSS